jgi:hypothetical protein
VIRRRIIDHAFRYFGAAWKQWIGLGLLLGLADAGVMIGRYWAASAYYFTKDHRLVLAEPLEIAAAIAADVAVTIISFLVAGSIIKVALAQIRGENPSLRLGSLSGRQVRTLILLAVSAALGMNVQYFLILQMGAWQVAELLHSIVSLLFTALFLLTIAFVVDKDKGPAEAAQLSASFMWRHLWRTFWVLFAFSLGMGVLLAPLVIAAMFLMGPEEGWTMAKTAVMAAGIIPFAAFYLPLYYLLVSLFYTDVVAPQPERPHPTGSFGDTAKSV